VTLIIIVDLYSLLRLHLGLACTRGIFSSRIYVTDSYASPLQHILGSGA